MWANIIVAVVSAGLGFLSKGVLDIWTERKARKVVATAIGGELGAYLELLRPEQTVQNVKTIATLPYEERVARLRGQFSHLPSGHPVFDRVADKIGTLPPNVALKVFAAYNIITSARLLLGSLSSEEFLAQSDDVQVGRIKTLASMFEQEIEGMRETVVSLNKLSR